MRKKTQKECGCSPRNKLENVKMVAMSVGFHGWFAGHGPHERIALIQPMLVSIVTPSMTHQNPGHCCPRNDLKQFRRLPRVFVILVHTCSA